MFKPRLYPHSFWSVGCDFSLGFYKLHRHPYLDAGFFAFKSIANRKQSPSWTSRVAMAIDSREAQGGFLISDGTINKLIVVIKYEG